MLAINELDNKYGKLTVIESAPKKNGNIMWTCQCECGNVIVTRGTNLRSGHTSSCGCERIKKAKQALTGKRRRKNELGNKYGKLTVIADAPSRKNRSYWLCKCECGNIQEVSGSSLRSGQFGCSGCKQVQNRVGKKYGKLTVIQQQPFNMWICKCDCGNEITIYGRYLNNGHVKSCGCMRSAGEVLITSILDNLQIKYEKQKTFDDCRFSNTQNLARFDFYLPDKNLIIEYDGEQHFRARGGWSSEEQLQYIQEHDTYKNNWCKENNIKLIRIPYTDFDKLNEDYILNLIQ